MVLNKINQKIIIAVEVNKNHPSEKIDHKKMINCPKYFKGNQG